MSQPRDPVCVLNCGELSREALWRLFVQLQCWDPSNSGGVQAFTEFSSGLKLQINLGRRIQATQSSIRPCHRFSSSHRRRHLMLVMLLRSVGRGTRRKVSYARYASHCEELSDSPTCARSTVMEAMFTYLFFPPRGGSPTSIRLSLPIEFEKMRQGSYEDRSYPTVWRSDHYSTRFSK